MSLKQEIEILPVSLLDEHRPLVNELKELADSLGIGFGWHYLLDLTWIISGLGDPAGKVILDAGAGQGLLQWYLVGKGARVVSVDRGERADLSLRYRARYSVAGLTPADLRPASAVWRKNVSQADGLIRKALTWGRGLAGTLMVKQSSDFSQVLIYNADLGDMRQIADASVDAVVSVSALEHNTPEALPGVVTELMRTLKLGAPLLASLGAARGEDWFHEASHGWNYTADSLRRLFALPADCPDNYEQHDALLADLCHCTELRDNLAALYFASGDNGMPWGKWNPTYQPVGVCKVKGN